MLLGELGSSFGGEVGDPWAKSAPVAFGGAMAIKAKAFWICQPSSAAMAAISFGLQEEE